MPDDLQIDILSSLIRFVAISSFCSKDWSDGTSVNLGGPLIGTSSMSRNLLLSEFHFAYLASFLMSVSTSSLSCTSIHAFAQLSSPCMLGLFDPSCPVNCDLALRNGLSILTLFLTLFICCSIADGTVSPLLSLFSCELEESLSGKMMSLACDLGPGIFLLGSSGALVDFLLFTGDFLLVCGVRGRFLRVSLLPSHTLLFLDLLFC